MVDDRFRVWDFKDEVASDDEVRKKYGIRENFDGAGAADPSKIDFKWHARNYEDIILALNNKSFPSISGAEARRAVALISAIYESAQSVGNKVEVV